jgi:septal ring factor EnvC (AmiA/AmiB activator)
MSNYTNEQINFEISMCKLRIHKIHSQLKEAQNDSYYRYADINYLNAKLGDEHVQLENWENMLLIDDETIEPLADSGDNMPSAFHSKPARAKTQTETQSHWARLDATKAQRKECNKSGWNLFVSFWKR